MHYVKAEKVCAVFNGHTIAVWVEDGPLIEFKVTDAKKLRKKLKTAIRAASN